MIKSSCFILLFMLSIANSQFYYNYEENTPVAPDTDTQNYDPSVYQYNTPSSANQQYVQSVGRNDETEGHRKTRIRVRSRNYQSEPNYSQPQQVQGAPETPSEVDQRAVRQERRQAKRRQRQRQRDYAVEPVLPPRVYSPSVFENIELGEAPTGIYIPQDSFLNVLRNQRANLPRPVSQPIAVVPQTTNYVQPSAGYVNSGNQSPFFVQPPSEEPRQRNLILPVTRPQVEYAVSTPRQTTNTRSQARAAEANRRPRQRVRIQPEYAEPPTVDIDALREYSDDVSRENVMSQVQYVPANIPRNPRPHNRRRTITNYQATTSAPRVYSPSIFEKVPLGEAPTGVYVPDDSLLNVLRSPSPRRHPTAVVARADTNIPLEQPTTYSSSNDYEAEVIEEEHYQPPLPPPPPTRRSPQRSSRMQPSRQSQRRGYQDIHEELPRSIQSSSQRQNQQNENFEDLQRQRSAVPAQVQSHRRTVSAQPRASAAAPRTQHQGSTSERSKPTFRKAKLAIAALPLDTDDDGIPGEAGVDYPTLHVIPRTAFSCSQQPHNGYYADLETSCQVVHLCQSRGVQNSFLCPNGTIFSQEKFSCQWWYKVNCSDAPKFYGKNDELYKVPEKEEKKRN